MPFGHRANLTQVSSAHLDELAALARRCNNRDRIYWLPDENEPELCDGEEFAGVRIKIRIRGQVEASFVAHHRKSMAGWLNTTRADTDPSGPWMMLMEHHVSADQKTMYSNSWVDQVTFTYPPSKPRASG